MTEKSNVLIMGVGLNKGGVGAAEYFAKRGDKVLVTDLKSEAQLKPSLEKLSKYPNIKYVLGKHRFQDFENTNLVIVNPAVSLDNEYVHAAQKANVPVDTQMGYFFKHKKCKVIGVTGTRGKSTTSNLIYKILESDGKKVALAGNIGESVLEILDDSDGLDFVVLELSSYMLEWLGVFRLSPETGVVTNILTDHLLRHKTIENYAEAKANIFLNQKTDGVLVVNTDNEYTKKYSKKAKGSVVTFSGKSGDADYWIEDSLIYEKGEIFLDVNSIVEDNYHPLAGEHNKMNILAAISTVRGLGVGVEPIETAVINYEGLYGRQMSIGSVGGVEVVNDTCATIPDAVIVALKRFNDKNIVLLTGGTDKELDYSELAEYLSENPVKSIVMLTGSGSDKLINELTNEKVKTPVHSGYSELKGAVQKALSIAEQGDLLLFSPGGTSFELFENEFDRGAQFDTIIKGYQNG